MKIVATRSLPLWVASALAFLPAGWSQATTIHVGQVIDDPGYDFSSFGQNSTTSTRGANFGGTFTTTWYGVTMTTDSSGGTNGISWTGSVANAVGSPGQYDYTGFSNLAGGSGTDANQITNTGIHGTPTINVTTAVGKTYSVDMLFANAFNARTLDVFVEGQLYLDNLAMRVDSESYDRPLVYRFQFVATDSQMTITFGPGAEPGYLDTNPYVNALMVTEVVPEPSTMALTAVGALGLLRRKRR